MCLGSEEHCEFLALVRDQKLCRHKELSRYQCYAVPDIKCSKDGGENMRSKPLTIAGGSATCGHLRTKEIPNHFPSLPQDFFPYIWISLLWGSGELVLNSGNSTFQAAVRHAVIQASFFCPDARLATDNPRPLVAPLSTAGLASVPFPHCFC